MPDTTTSSPDVAAILAAARPAERAVRLFLRGDLQAEQQLLEQQIMDRRAAAEDDAGPDEVTDGLVERLREVYAEQRRGALDVRVRAFPHARWRELVEAHPPRRDPEAGTGDVLGFVGEDGELGFDKDAFMDEAIPEAIVAPELTGEQLEQLLAVVTQVQWNQLAAVVYAANTMTATEVAASGRATEQRIRELLGDPPAAAQVEPDSVVDEAASTEALSEPDAA